VTTKPIHVAAAEFNDVDLGDSRLNKRLGAIVARAVVSPGESFPKMVPTEAEREAFYRFIENDRVEWSEILVPHHYATAARCCAAKVVRVAHDTSWFSFEGDRQGLGPIAGNERGFAGHFSLAISAEEQRAPLGVLALSTFVRSYRPRARTKEERAAKHFESKLKSRKEKESVRWIEGIRAAEARVGANVICIHVMDQEADNFAIFADLCETRARFVVRGSTDRRLDSTGKAHVGEVLERVTARVFRKVHVAPRTKASPGHPLRKERDAALMIRGTSILLPRPTNAQHPTKKLQLNVVHVFEPAPPDGEEPIEWALYTTERIDSHAALAAVVDHYRARWRIEEYFKALKTGCAFEKRQLTTYDSLLRALALLAPIAWHLLAIRTVARDAGGRPASDIVDDVQLQVLRFLAPSSNIPRRPKARDVMRAIADVGGHVRQNGEPGWLVLGRGFGDFVKAEMVWRAALAAGRSDQS
jgi:hypothetical protein